MNNQSKSKTELPGTRPETPEFAKKTGGEVVFLPQGVPVLGIGASAGGLDAFKLLLGTCRSIRALPSCWCSTWSQPIRAC